MCLPVLRQLLRLWILVPAACCFLLCGEHGFAQMQLEPSSASLSIAERFFSLPSTELPDAPSAQFKDPTPPPLDANRLQPLEADDETDTSDTPDIPDNAEISLNHVNIPALYKVLRVRHPERGLPDGSENPITLQGVASPERYHWGGLIAQSFFFNGVESAFRIASDDQIRYLVAKKPFWHDYVASIKQFNMRRWSDGDNFLVNYVGHPMQGSVSAYIEIQNSPTDRELELSATRAYWMSRFRGFLWAVAFSTHSEISPLGEAGIGNEGGWTYPINCHRPCPTWNPKKMHYTNNTGWVDFIITPTVGMLWVLAEDTLDRYVSDRIQGTDQKRILPKIIRGSLNPSRSFANAMRLKKPWYRDFQHNELVERSRPGIHMLRSDDESPRQQKLRRFSVAGHYRSMPLGTYLKSCFLCFAGHGGGFEADYAITPWLSASFALDKQQGLSNKNATVDGTALFTGFGIRLFHDRPHNAFSFAIRPGFVLDDAVIPAHVDVLTGNYIPEKSSDMQHTAVTLLAANDYKINRTFAIRSSLGATVVRYRTAVNDPPEIGKPPYLSWLSPKNYTNHTTWVWQGGPVVRF
jgi:hypothetical protein